MGGLKLIQSLDTRLYLGLEDLSEQLYEASPFKDKDYSNVEKRVRQHLSRINDLLGTNNAILPDDYNTGVLICEFVLPYIGENNLGHLRDEFEYQSKKYVGKDDPVWVGFQKDSENPEDPAYNPDNLTNLIRESRAEHHVTYGLQKKLSSALIQQSRAQLERFRKLRTIDEEIKSVGLIFVVLPFFGIKTNSTGLGQQYSELVNYDRLSMTFHAAEYL